MKHLLLATMIMLSITTQSQTVMRIHQSNGTVLQIPISTIDSITYTNSNPGSLATLTTLAIGNITANSATSGGSITADGGSPVTQRGICWATTQNPTTANNTAVSGTGTGSFTANLTGLTANTTYYVRAYAINTAGTAYGNQLSFTTTQTPVNPGTVTDASGNTYPTVTIGTQVWMAENLRTTKYRDGINIPLITDNTQWANNWNNGIPLSQPMMCWYNNDQATYTANKFGALYNWYAINPATNGNKNVCPTGWHVPTDAEWTTLTNFLGGESAAGGKMKSTGTQYWPSPNTNATNSSGWSGLPGGYRGFNGPFYDIGLGGIWWSSTELSTVNAWFRNLSYLNGDVNRNSASKTIGFSVRCVRD
ncbi:MAG: FISUMP domain-containing protein [Bacteroidota bacterium]